MNFSHSSSNTSQDISPPHHLKYIHFRTINIYTFFLATVAAGFCGGAVSERPGASQCI